MKGGHPDVVPLTAEERKAIAALVKLGKTWPKSLWVFGGSGNHLPILRTGEDGMPVYAPDSRSGDKVDQAYVVGSAAIPNDGGDW